MKLTHWLLGIAGGFIFAGQAQAVFVIDDFNVDTSSSVVDTVSDSTPVTGTRAIDGSNVVMEGAGWTRTLSANLSAGDNVETEVCSFCKAGHANSGAAGSAGNFAWIYDGSSQDLSSYTGVSFEYASDLDGAIIQLVFSNGDIIASGALANTNNSADITNPANRTPVSLALGSGVYSGITNIRINVLGVSSLDFSIDNVQLKSVPEPTTLALMGLGLAGIGYRRHRSKIAA